MDKKTILVIILAGVLALVGAFIIFKLNNKSQQIQQPIKNEQSSSDVESIIKQEPEKNEVYEQSAIKAEVKTKPIQSQPIKNVSYKTTEVTESPKIEHLVVKEESVSVEPEKIQNDGVIQEENSTDVIITKEYKIQTPSRYTFK